MKKQQGTAERWKYIKENDLSIAQSNQVSLRQLHAVNACNGFLCLYYLIQIYQKITTPNNEYIIIYSS
jgi:hypothetical protein